MLIINFVSTVQPVSQSLDLARSLGAFGAKVHDLRDATSSNQLRPSTPAQCYHSLRFDPSSLEFTINHPDNQQHQNRNNRNRDQPIGSHPVRNVSTSSLPSPRSEVIPTRHPPQRLHTAIHIPLALQQIPVRVLNHIPLLV